MGLDANFAEAKQTVVHAELEAELAKSEYVKLCSSEKKKNKGNKPKGSRSEVTNSDSEALASAKGLKGHAGSKARRHHGRSEAF
jgi:hypothetical protein